MAALTISQRRKKQSESRCCSTSNGIKTSINESLLSSLCPTSKEFMFNKNSFRRTWQKSIILLVLFVVCTDAKKHDSSAAYVPPMPYPGKCIICDPNPELKIKPDTITFVYKSSGVSSAWQPTEKASCEADSYPLITTLIVMDKDGIEFETITVSEGDMLVIGNGYHLPDETHFAISGYGECFIHTSCTVPLVPGDQIGPFFVHGGNNCTHVPTNSECIVPDQTSYTCGEPISLSWDLAQSYDGTSSPYKAFSDDWVGIYPCDADPNSLPNVWQSIGCNHKINGKQRCDSPAADSGIVSFSGLHNDHAEPYAWPIHSSNITCYKAIYANPIGPSIFPFATKCSSTTFDIVCPNAPELASQR